MKRLFLKSLIWVSFILTFYKISAQNNDYVIFKSPKYGYEFEIPPNYTHMSKTGKNVDLKVVDKYGNSLIIVINKLPVQDQAITIDNYLSISNFDWEQNVQLPNVKVRKKGPALVDNQRGMFLHYSTQGYTDTAILYHINYMFIYNKMIYNLTATCDITVLTQLQPVFFRALQSFKF